MRGLIVPIPEVVTGMELGEPFEHPFKRFHVMPGWRDVPRVPKYASVGPDVSNLQRWLFFWDQLASPGDPEIPRTPEENFLISEGILQIIPTGYRSDELGERVLDLFKKMEVRSPGRWCIATDRPIAPSELPVHRDILVRLYNVLPLPVQETPLTEIIEFRRRRSDELTALRVELEDAYQRIASSSDRFAAEITELDRLGRAVTSVMETVKETGWKIRFLSLEARIKWEADIKDIALGAGAGMAIGGMLGGCVGAAAGLIPKVEISTGAGVGDIRRSGSPYHYIGLAHNQFGRT